jgi:hypothetical protein
MIRAASSAAVSPTASSAVASSAVMSAAAPAAVEATASTTAVETTTTAAAAVTAATTLRERSRRAKQRHRSDCAKQNLEESGPVHGCNLHPATLPKRCGRPEPEAILHQLDSHGACLVAEWLSRSPSANHASGENRTPALEWYNTGDSKKFRWNFGTARVGRYRGRARGKARSGRVRPERRPGGLTRCLPVAFETGVRPGTPWTAE